MGKLRGFLKMALFGLACAAAGYGVALFLRVPPAFDLSQIEFPRAVREEQGMPVVQVFFATNRALLPGSVPPAFTDGCAKEMVYGVAGVRIPETYTVVDVQRPDTPRGEIDPERARILEIQTMGEAEFSKRLRGAAAAGAGVERPLLFVHGIQNSLDSALRQAGTLAFSLNLPQPMVCFGWPTDPSLSAAAYRRSQEQVADASLALAEFVESQLPTRFDILAHSLGCKVVCKAMEALSGEAGEGVPEGAAPIGNVVLAAPDVDRGDFQGAFAAPVSSSSGRATVYVARNDSALVLSSFLNGGARAGSGLDPMAVVEGIYDEDAGDAARVEIVDATFVNSALTSHGYFYQSRAALADLHNLLRNDLPACQRQLLRHERAKHSNYWVIPP